MNSTACALNISHQMQDTAYISTVSMWLAEVFPMTRYMRHNHNRWLDSSHSPDNMYPKSLVPVPVTIAVLANIYCCMVYRKSSQVFEGIDGVITLEYYIKVI